MSRDIFLDAVLFLMTPFEAALAILDIKIDMDLFASSVFFSDISFSKLFAIVFNSCLVAIFFTCLTLDLLRSL